MARWCGERGLPAAAQSFGAAGAAARAKRRECERQRGTIRTIITSGSGVAARQFGGALAAFGSIGPKR